MIGTTLSARYEIQAELGRGGMGVVYRARDTLLGRDVAVKLIPPTQLSAESEERFRREAHVVAQMDHPSIVSIYDLGHHEGSFFLVMPLLQGRTLRSFLREGSPSLGDVIDAGIELAEALDYSHARGVIHRDVKPENVMVVREESGRVRVRVMDFGLARAAGEGRITTSGALVGTLAYLSPEQVAKREVDSRCDIYSLGTVLYECVVGAPPFCGEVEALLYRIVHEIPQPPRAMGAIIDEEMEAVILGCLAKEPARRPQRAAEVAEALRRYRWRLRDNDLARLVFAQTAPIERPPLAPFIGRGREFAELQQRLSVALSGECQVVLVAGEPGIGKTRLIEELEKLARARGIRVLRGRTVERDRSFPYQGFCELIQEYFRLKETGSSALPDLSDLASDLVSLFPTLGEIPHVRSAATRQPAPGRPATGPENQTYVFELLARALARIAGGRPLVLLFEDLHGAEVSVGALQYIARRLGPTPTLIVGTYRSTEVDGLHPVSRMLEDFRGDRRFCLLVLEPLSPAEHRSYLETLVGARALSEELARGLYERTSGNPFFTRELVPALVDSGTIAKDETGLWCLSSHALSTGALPATIQEAVEKRIQRLPRESREILQVASVIGRTFSSRDLETLAEGKGDVEEALDHLLKDGLVQEERESRGGVLAFSSGLVRDALYVALPRRTRKLLHRRHAEQIEARYQGRLERAYPQLLHHFAQGDVPDKAVGYGLALGRKSLAAFSAESALNALRTVLDYVQAEGWSGDRRLEGEAHALVASAWRMLGDLDGGLREAAASARVFEELGEAGRHAAACLLAAETAWQGRRIPETRTWLERGIEAARTAGERETLRRLLNLGVTVANLRGEHAVAKQYLEEAERLVARGGESAQDGVAPRGGRLLVGLVNPVHAREPGQIAIIEEEEVLLNVFEPLLAADAEGSLVPRLCEGWEMLEEGDRFRLGLRRDVRFHDGCPLTAAEVKASFERSARKASGGLPAAYAAIRGMREFVSGEASDVAGLVAASEHTLEVGLSQPLPILPALLTDALTGIARAPDEGSALVGTGPFRLVAHGPERVVLERNPEYWGGASRLDAIEFRASLTASAVAAGLRSGELDLARDLLPETLDEILRHPRFRQSLVEVPKTNVYFVLFNCKRGEGPSKSREVRRALAGVLRPHDLVWRTLGRFAQPAAGLIPPGILGYDPGRRRAPMDRDEAVAALRAAGIVPPVRLRAAVHPLLLDRYDSLTKALRDIWSELGVEVEIATSGLETFLDAFEAAGSFDLMIARWNADYADPDNFTHGLFHSSAGAFRRYFSSDETDSLAERARAERRNEVRESLYRQFEDRLAEAGALIPLFHDIDYRIASPRVRGLRLRGNAPYVNYPELGKVESAPAPAVRSGGGVLQVPIAGVLASLDPSLAWTVEQSEVVPNIFESLTRDLEGARNVPWLAAELSVEQGGSRFRFRLREGIRFHDGRRLTARDVRYSWERLLRLRRSAHHFLSPIRGARELMEQGSGELAGFHILSATEFTVELEEPVSFFPVLVSHPATAIVPEGCDPGGEDPQGVCVGTGPFRVVQFEPGQRVELARNPAYWRSGYPRSEGLVFHVGVAPEVVLSEFRAGRLHLASDLVPQAVEALRQDPEFASGYREAPSLSTYLIAFAVHRGPLADARCRRRLARALDVDALVRRTLGPLAAPAQGLIPPGLLGYEPTHLRAGARASPTDSGVQEAADALVLTAAVHPVFLAEYAGLADELLKALRDRGVEVRRVNETMGEYLEALRTGAVDLVVGRWEADYPDADTFVHGLLQAKAGFFGCICGTAEVDALAERGRAETDPVVRHSLYRRVEEIIVRDVLLLPLFHEQIYRFARPEVDGLELRVSRPAVAYETLSIRG